MADNKCAAIKKCDGLRCSKTAKTNGRCAMHHGIVVREGPNHTELNELVYTSKARLKVINQEAKDEIQALGPNAWHDNREAFDMIIQNLNERRREHNRQQNQQFGIIVARQRAEIARTGIDPDAVQNAAREVVRQARLERRVREIEHWRRRAQERNQERLAFAVQEDVLQREGLGGFANDRQNVHTTTAVKQTMETIKEILKIDVPLEYRWNMRNVSKTVTEVISECQLSPASTWQMISKYCSDEQIYDLQNGIYGKVLDCVWQYIKNSSDKEDLKKILKSEMTDNIGMCAQGNLSRLTNILAGYLDCIVAEESITDKLGRMLPPLMEIEDIPTRLSAAVRIFKYVGLPEDQWQAWGFGLLIDQEEDDYREMYIHDGMIEFVAFR
jgi:hypothetical protein